MSSSTNQEQDVPGSFPENDSTSAVSSQKTLSEALYARRADYARPHTVRIKVGTWNVAGKKGTEHDVGDWFIGGKGVSESLTGLRSSNPGQGCPEKDAMEGENEEATVEGAGEQEQRRSKKRSTLPKGDHGETPGGEDVGLYVLGLQEIVDISSATETLRPYADPTASKRWRKEIEDTLPEGYQLVAEQQLIGLLLLIYASPKVMPHVGAVSTTSIGTGLMGYMGNKGAVTTRIVLGETTRLVFINSHLSSGLGKAELERRNWDAATILSRTKFEPILDSLGYMADRGENIGDEDFTFWFGDLNYRLEGIPGDDVRRLLMLHIRNEYDLGDKSERKIEEELSESTESLTLRHSHETSPSASISSRSSLDTHSSESTVPGQQGSLDILDTLDENEPLDPSVDPTSLQTALNSLLVHDELKQQMKSRKIFHDGWKEGPINFLPTYKYDTGSVGLLDSSEKRRAPSWCDRILYRTRKSRTDFENILVEEEHARMRDEEMKSQGIDQAKDDEDTLFEYDPDADNDDDGHHDAAENAIGALPSLVTTREGFDDIITLEYYVSHQRVLSSDHKPLDAVFKLEYDAADPELKSKVHQEVARDLDRAENEGRPAVTLVVDGHTDGDDMQFGGVNFGKVRFEARKIRSFTVANTGRVDVDFGFVTRPIEETETLSPTPSWLSARVKLSTDQSDGGASKVESTSKGSGWAKEIPETFSLKPGDACPIKLTIEVSDNRLIKRLNEGEKLLEDVLILRVREGRDHFIPVHGSWQQTIYGRTVDALTRLPEGGIRKLQHQHPKGISNKQLTDENAVKFSVPPAFHRLTEAIEALTERIVSERSMKHDPTSNENATAPWTEQPGWPFASKAQSSNDEENRTLRLMVNEAIETDQALSHTLLPETSPRLRVEILSDVLIRLLTSLEDGIVTEILWNKIEQDYFGSDPKTSKSNLANDDKRAAVLEILSSSSCHSVSFILITSMLSRMAQEISSFPPVPVQNGMTSLKRSASILASTRLAGRRKTGALDSKAPDRPSINKKFADIFADLLVRSPEQHQKSKASRNAALLEERKRQLLEVFIDSNA